MTFNPKKAHEYVVFKRICLILIHFVIKNVVLNRCWFCYSWIGTIIASFKSSLWKLLELIYFLIGSEPLHIRSFWLLSNVFGRGCGRFFPVQNFCLKFLISLALLYLCLEYHLFLSSFVMSCLFLQYWNNDNP